jgi:murein DD-endopeptidase MepM/ murein hydrolase activator NlpD
MRAGNLERCRLALVALGLLSLAACTTSPRTQLDWDLRDDTPQPQGPRTVRFEGSVTLPPVQRIASIQPHYRSVATAPVQESVLAPVQKPVATPAWYNWRASPPQQQQPAASIARDAAQDAPEFRWPVTGRILSPFGGTTGGERNDGINIAATQGEPVHAAAAGTVTYCGNELKGYGNLVLIRHDGGYVTAYAHADSILVGRGDRVSAGQVIATAGSTGDVAAPQLHFEIRHGIKPLDPRALLPGSLAFAGY